MASTLIISILSLATFALAAPAPLVTGAALPPNIAWSAGGGPPNSPGAAVSQNGINLFGLTNFLENLESNFFQTGLQNLTAWGTAGSINGHDNLDIVSHVAAQEEVHVAGLVGILTGSGAQPIPPCQYQFPVCDAESFFALANIITCVGIGALIDLQANLAPTDPGVIPAVGSILPVEARHDAFFRLTASELPNPGTFDTRISGIWAYNMALDFVVPGSCPFLPPFITSLPVFPNLAIIGAGEPSFATPNAPGCLTFIVVQSDMLPNGWSYSAQPLFMAWVNERNIPAYTPVTVVNDYQLQADVPPGLFGMAFVALTNQNTAKNINDLTAATIAGPLPIPVT